jgi:hypothetical protein
MVATRSGSLSITATARGFVSSAFTIDKEDQAKVMAFSFYYEASGTNLNFSGTSSNTFAIYIAEVNPSSPETVISWIQPAGVYNMTQGTGVGLASGTFQTTATGTSYRLAVFAINSITGGSSIKFDDFQLGPQKVVYGSPVTDWVSYTPTITHNSGGITNAAVSGKYRRVGDSIEVYGTITFSAPSAAFSEIFVSTPSGLVIDSSKLGVTTSLAPVLGTAFCYNAGSTLFGPSNVAYRTPTLVDIRTPQVGGSNVVTNTITNTNPFTFDSGDTISWHFTAPISGLSSSVQMSNDTDTRVVAGKFYRSGTAQSVSNGSTTLTFDTALIDTHGSFVPASNAYRIPVSGYYRASAALFAYANPAASVSWLDTHVGLSLDGAGIAVGDRSDTVGERVGRMTSSIFYANAGQLLTAYIYTVSGAGSTLIDHGPSSTHLAVERISGPATIAASETVAMRYSTSAAPSISNNSATAITFGTKVFDTHGAYSGSIYTVPVSGKYRFSMALYSVSTAASMTDFQIICYKNGAQAFGANFPKGGTSTTPGGGNLSGTIDCVAGDTLQGRWLQTSGGSLDLIASGDWNWISIERVGN